MGGMGLPGLWLFLALVVAASVFLAVGSVWLANKTVHRPGAKEESGSLSPFVIPEGVGRCQGRFGLFRPRCGQR